MILHSMNQMFIYQHSPSSDVKLMTLDVAHGICQCDIDNEIRTIPIYQIYLNKEDKSNEKYPVKIDDVFDHFEVEEEHDKVVFNLAYSEIKPEYADDLNTSDKILDVDRLIQKILKERKWEYSQALIDNLSQQIKHENLICYLQSKQKVSLKPLIFTEDFFISRAAKNYIKSDQESLAPVYMQYFKYKPAENAMKTPQRMYSSSFRNFFRFSSIYLQQQNDLIQMLFDCYNLLLHNTHCDIIEKKFAQKIHDILCLKGLKIMNYSFYYNLIEEYYNDKLKKEIEIIDTDQFSILERFHIIHLKIIPFYFQITILYTYLAFLDAQKRQKIKINLPNIQKLMLCFKRVLQSKFPCIFHCEQLLKKFNQHVKKVVLEESKIQNIWLTMYKNQIETPNIQKQFSLINQTITDKMEYISKLLEVIYISIGDTYELDDKHIVITSVSKILHLTHFYVSNTVDEQEESEDDDSFYEQLGQKKEQKPQLKATSFYQLNRLYDDAKQKAKVSYEGLHLMNTDSYIIDDGKIELMQIDHQIFEFINALNKQLAQNDFENILGQLMTADKAIIKLKQILVGMKEIKSFTSTDQLKKLSLNVIDDIADQIEKIKLDDLHEQIQILERNVAIINSTTNEVKFKIVTLQLEEVKKNVTDNYNENISTFHNYVTTLSLELATTLKQQTLDFVKETLIDLKNPDYFGLILLLRKQFNKKVINQKIFKLIDTYLNMLIKVAEHTFLDAEKSGVLIDAAIDILVYMELFYKYCSEEVMREQIKVYTDMIKAFDAWLYEHVYELSQRIQEFLNIKEYHFNLTKEETLEFMQIYKMSCINIEIRPLNVEEKYLYSQHAMNFIQLLQQYLKLQIKCKIFLKAGVKTNQNVIPSDAQKVLTFNQNLFIREKVTFKHNSIDLRKVVGELLFVAQQYYTIFYQINKWRQDIYSINQDENMHISCQPVYPGPNYLVNLIYPVYIILNNFEQLDKLYEDSLNKKFNEIDINLIELLTNRLIYGFQEFNKHCTTPCKVFNNKYDYIVGKQEQDEYLAYQLEYVNWQWRYNQYIDKFKIILHDAAIMYMGNKIYNLAPIKPFCMYFVQILKDLTEYPQIYDVTVKEFFEQNDKTIVFDKFLFVGRLYILNISAIMIINQLKAGLDTFTVIDQFKYQVKLNLSEQNKHKYNVFQLVFSAPNIQDYVHNALHQLSLIINNQGFVDKIQLNYQSQYENVLKFVELCQIPIKQKEIFNSRFNYIPPVQQMLRDFEVQLNNTLLVYTTIKRIPYLLQELLIICHDGNLISCAQNTVNGCQEFQVNILNEKEKNQIYDINNVWLGLVQYTFQIGEKLSTVAMKPKILQELINICIDADILHSKIHLNKQQNIIQQLTSFYNKTKNIVESTFELKIQYDTSIPGVVSSTQKILIPYYNGKSCTQAVAFPNIFTLFFGQYIRDKNLINNISTFRKEGLFNIDQIITNYKLVNGLQSGKEKLLYAYPIQLPKYNFIVMDSLLGITQTAIYTQSGIGYKAIKQIYSGIANGDNVDELAKKYMTDFTYHIIFIGLSTILYQKYQQIIKEKHLNDKAIFDLSTEVKLIELLQKYINYQEDEYQYKAYMCRFSESKYIFEQIQEQFNKQTYVEIVTNEVQYPFIYYDESQMKVQATNNLREFVLPAGSHWLGQPTLLEQNLQFNKHLISQVVQGLWAITENLTLIVVGNKEQELSNVLIEQYLMQLSRFVCRKYIIIPISEITFATNLQQIISFLISGYLVMLIGIEFIPNNQVLEIVNLSNNLYNKKGQLPGLVMCQPKNVNENKEDGGGQLDYVQSVLGLQEADIASFDDIGSLLLYFPCLENVEQVTRFHYESDELLGVYNNEEGQPINKFNMHNSMQINEHSNILINKFENYQMVQLWDKQPVEYFISIDKRFGEIFYQIHCYMAQYNTNWPRINSKTVKLYLELVKNETNPMDVSIVTMIFLLQQYYQILYKDNILGSAEHLSMIVSTCFEIDSYKRGILKDIAVGFLYIKAEQLIQLKYKTYADFNLISKDKDLTQQIRIKTFDQYLTEVSPYLSDKYLKQLYTYSQLYNIPVQMVSDILKIRLLLRLGQPLLVSSMQSSYNKQITSVLASINKQKLFYVVNDIQLCQQLKQIEDLGNPESLIVITVYKMQMLYRMMDQILGMFLQQKKIRNNLNLTHYIYHDNIQFILLMDFNLVKELALTKYNSLFTNKLIMTSPQFCENNKKLFIRSIQVQPSKFIQFFKLSGFHFSRQPIQNMINSITSYNQTLDQKLPITHQRLYCLQYLTQAIISKGIVLIFQIFQVKNKIEDYLLLRSIFLNFLQRQQVINISTHKMDGSFGMGQVKRCKQMTKKQMIKSQNENINYSMGYDSMNRTKIMIYQIFENMKADNKEKDYETKENIEKRAQQYYKDSLTLNLSYILDEIFPVPAIGGYYYKDMQYIQQKIEDAQRQARENNIKLDLNTTIAQAKAFQQINDVGLGFCGSLFYDMSFQYIFQNLILPDTNLEAFSNLTKTIFIALLNSASLYSQIILKTDSKYFKERYTQVCNAFQTEQILFSNEELELFKPAALLLAKDKDFQKIDYSVMQYMNANSTINLEELNIEINKQQLIQLTKLLFNSVNKLMPQPEKIQVDNSDNIQYLHYSLEQNRYELLNYECEQGIFDDISLLTDKQQLEKYKQMKEEGKEYKIRISLQNFTQMPIYLDSKRLATAFIISCAMQAPITASVVGIRALGKSTLIDIAKLLCIDAVSYNNIILSNMSSKYSSTAVLNQITTCFQLKNYKQSQLTKNKQQHIANTQDDDDIILDYNLTNQFPCYHFHLSELQPHQQVDDKFKLLFNDHMIFVNNMDPDNDIMFGQSSINKMIGCVNLSDCSFIVECSKRSQVIASCQLIIEVPILSEKFLTNYFQSLYPNQSYDWNNRFIKGYFMLKSSIPPQLANNFTVISKLFENQIYLVKQEIVEQNIEYIKNLNNYNKRRYEGEIPCTELLQENLDDELIKTNIHCMEYSLRSIGSVSANKIHEINDRIASLTILGYLQDELPNLPWSDCKLFLTGKYTIYNLWEAQIINFALQESRPQIVPNKELIGKMIATIPILVPDKNQIFINEEVDLEYQYVLQNVFVNPYWYGHIIEIAKQIEGVYDPLVLCRSFELFLKLIVNQRKQINQFKSLENLKTNLAEIDNYNSIFSLDPFQQSKQDLINIYNTKKEQLKQLEQRQNQIQDEIDESEIRKPFKKEKVEQQKDDLLSKFRQKVTINKILTSFMNLSFRVQKYYVTLINTQQHAYQMIVDNIERFSSYRQIREGQSLQQNIIFDINYLLESINVDKSDPSIDLDKLPFLDQLRRFNRLISAKEYLSKDIIFIILITLLRVALSLAIGIDPLVWLEVPSQQNAYDSISKLLGIIVTSKFHSRLPCTVIENGMKLSQMPLDQRPIEKIMQRQKDPFTDAETSPYISQLETFLAEPHDVVIITSKSIVDMETPSGVQILTLLTNTLNNMNVLETLFSSVEQQFILHVLSRRHGINQQLSSKHLALLLASSVSLIVISDDPCGGVLGQSDQKDASNMGPGGGFEIQKLVPVNSIKSPMLSFISNLLDDREVIKQDTYRQQLHKIKAFDLEQLKMPLKIVDPLIQRLVKQITLGRHNLINIEQKHMLQLYKISDCYLPVNVELPDKVKVDKNQLDREFSLAVVQIYNYLAERAKGPCVSLTQFSKTAMQLTSSILNKCQIFFQAINNIFVAYRLYASILGGKTDEDQVIYDLSTFDFDHLSKIIRASQEQVVDGTKQFVADVRTQTIAEAKAIRDLLYSVILCLQPEFQQYKYISQMAHLDAVCLTGFLYFSTTGLVTNQQAYKLLIQEFTNAMEDWFSSQLEQCNKVESGICAFNLLLTAILGQSGFKVYILDPKEMSKDIQEHSYQDNQQKSQKNQFKAGVLGQNALQTGEMLFLSNYMDAGGFDWPVFVLQSAMNIPWQLRDNYTICLNSVATFAQIGFKTFITKGEMAIPAACLIEAIKADKQQPKQYYKISSQLLQIGNIKKQVQNQDMKSREFTRVHSVSGFAPQSGNTVDPWKGASRAGLPESQQFSRSQFTRNAQTRDASSRATGASGGVDNPGATAARVFTNDMLKRVSTIDLALPPAQFDTTLQKALTYGDHSLLFIGYGRDTDNTVTNATTLQKLLRLRSSGTAKRKTVVQIRSVSVIINNDLENYNIIIGMDTGKNIIHELQKAGLLTQEFLDQCAICDDYGKTDAHDSVEEQSNKQYNQSNEIAQIQFQLLQGCYGPKASARGLVETIRLSVKSATAMIQKTSITVLNFIKQQIMRVKKDIAQHELTPARILTIIQDYVKFAQLPHRSQNVNAPGVQLQQNMYQNNANNPQMAIYQMSIFKENNDKLFEDLKEMLNIIKSLQQSILVKQHTKYNVSGFQEKGQALLIESQEYRIIRSDSLKLCRYVAIQIAQIQKDVKKLSIAHLPAEYLASGDHYKQIQQFISEKVIDMRQQLRLDDAIKLVKQMQEQNEYEDTHLSSQHGTYMKQVKFNLDIQLPSQGDNEIEDQNSLSIDEYNDQILTDPIKQGNQQSDEQQAIEKANEFYLNEASQDIYYHRYCYPISYLIRTDQAGFIKFLAKSYIQHFNETAIKLLPTQMQWPFYNYIHTIFLSLLGITHFSYDVKQTSNEEDIENNEKTDELMLLRQALSINYNDYIKLITTSQLTNVLYKNSSFNLEKLGISSKIVSQILKTLPEQCKLSIQILILWLNISFASKYNLIIKDSLLWLLQHTSCMIAFSKVKNPLASMIEYWYNTQSISRDKYAHLLEKTLKIIPQEYFEFKISQLPPAFEDISEKSLFSALIMTILLYPNQLDFTFRIYSLVISDTIGEDYRTIKEKNKVSLHRNIPCIITQLNHVDLDGKLLKEQMISQVYEAFRLLFKLCGIKDVSKDKITDIFISKQLYQMYSYLSNVYTTTSNKIGIIFYDQSINIQDLIIFSHNLINDSEEMHVQQVPCHDNFLSNYNMYILLPDIDGCQIIEQIYTILDAQLTSHTASNYRPILICIPSSTTARHPNCTYFCSSSINNEAEVQIFLQKLQKLQSRVEMMYCYISQENNLFDNIRHNICTTVQTVYLMALQHIKILRATGDKETTISSLKIVNHHSIRGFLIMILRQAIKQLRPSGDISDQTIIQIVRRAFQNSFITKDHNSNIEGFDVENSSFHEIVMADLVFLQVPKQMSLGFDKILTNRINHEIIQLLFGQKDGIGCLFREQRAIIERKLVPLNINEKEEMDQQAEEDIEIGSIKDTVLSRSQSTFSQTTDPQSSVSRQNSQIIYTNKLKQKKQNYVQAFAAQGGMISSTAQHLLKKKGKILEEETNVYNQLEINLHQVGKKIQQVESIDAEIFELSIKELLGENTIHIQDINIDIQFKERYVSIDEVIELMWQLTRYNENYQRETEVKNQFLDFLSSTFYHRAFFSSRSFIQSYIPMPLELSLKTIAKNQRLYFKLIGQNPHQDFLLRRLGPQEILDGLVPNTSFVPKHISLNQYYLQLKETVIFSVPAFQALLGNLLTHLKLYNAQLTNTPVIQQRIIITIKPPSGPLTISPDGNIEQGIPLPQFKYYTMRGFQLINAYYDSDLDTIADVTTESVSGYSCMMDLYVSVAVVTTEQSGRGIIVPGGYVPVPLQISGQVKPFVLMPNRSGLPDHEWTRRNIFFGIPQW